MKTANMGITARMYILLKRCGMSEQMVDHLMVFGDVSEWTFNHIICGAPISLYEKVRTIEEYMALHQIEKGILENTYHEMLSAQGELELLSEWEDSDGMLYLFAEWYDLDVYIEKSSPVGMFTTAKDAFEYIKNEDRMEQEDLSEDDDRTNGDWYRLELWEKDPEGRMEHTYDYYIYNGQICWFNEMKGVPQNHGNIYYWPESLAYSRGVTDLNLSTPFSSGDIVAIDCRPFGPWFPAIILEDYDQFDCCLPTILFNVPYTQVWRCSSLVHKHLFYDSECHSYEPLLSPLYRLRKLDESELEKIDTRLLKLKELIDKDSNHGMKIWTKLDWDDMTYEKLIELIEKAVV